jgi:hypothetical protein
MQCIARSICAKLGGDGTHISIIDYRRNSDDEIKSCDKIISLMAETGVWGMPRSADVQLSLFGSLANFDLTTFYPRRPLGHNGVGLNP